jgi:hypothetical protein
MEAPMSAFGRLAFKAMIVALATSSLHVAASVPTVDDCFEASDFIANAARSRDNGMTRAAFIDRLNGDFQAIRAFPAEMRWFVRDEEDERFLEGAAEQVFDAPASPADHRREFLRACFDRLSI